MGGDSRAPVLGTVSLTTNRLIPAQGLYLKSGEFDLDNLHGLFLIDAVDCSRRSSGCLVFPDQAQGWVLQGYTKASGMNCLLQGWALDSHLCQVKLLETLILSRCAWHLRSSPSGPVIQHTDSRLLGTVIILQL